MTLVATGCGSPQREPALTAAQSKQVLVLGLRNARFTPGDMEQLQQEFVASIEREIEYRRRAGLSGRTA